MRKLILKHTLSPGDVVMLTAAVRDLHLAHPGQFAIDVRTPSPALWENNSHLTPIADDDAEAEVIECHYPLIHRSNQTPHHFIHGFIEFVNERLGLQIKPTAFKGDIHVSDLEKSWWSQVHEITGEDTPFWILVAGGKYDFTAKWWAPERYQEVVDHFRGKVLFVQVGESGHYHPPLKGVLDLRGKTDLRQLVRLVYHAQGVLCPVTSLMHLAAAVEVKGGRPRHRPCVVIAGGREPAHWEAYTPHQFIHTCGALSCCDEGGCWRSRVRPIADGDEKDRPDKVCVDVVGQLPRCLDMIPAAEVIRRIELYYHGGALQYLSAEQAAVAQAAIEKWNARFAAEDPTNTRASMNIRFDEELTPENARAIAEKFIQHIPSCPGGFAGRGIVIAGGGVRYFPAAWVCLKLLRHWGCQLPVQMWHLGPKEMDERMKALVKPLGVECVDALAVRQEHPARILNGWELKPYAILHCSFKEVLFLDADNVPLVNPEFLFETPQFQDTGAVFWPDFGRLEPLRPIWEICGVTYRDEPEFESGQIVVDKERCWKALKLCLWYNEHSDFYYRYVHGDKETFHLAFRKLDQPYAMPTAAIYPLEDTMCQHDFDGRRILQHRNLDKWNLLQPNKEIWDFQHEDQCRAFLDELRGHWDGRIGVASFDRSTKTTEELRVADEVTASRFEYHRVGYDRRPIGFRPDGTVGAGAATREIFWDVKANNGDMLLELIGEDELTCRLRRDADGVWRGQWLRFERMPIKLIPLDAACAETSQ